MERYVYGFLWFLAFVGVVVSVALVVCYLLELYFSAKERAARLKQAIADAEQIVDLRDLGELGANASGESHTHTCGNRLRVGSKLKGGRTVLYCPFCFVEILPQRVEEPQSSRVVVPFDPFRRLSRVRKLGSPNPPPTAA